MSSGLVFSLIGFAIYVGGLLWLQNQAIRAEMEFFRRYREKRGLDLPFEPAEMEARYLNQPWRLIIDAPRRSLRMTQLETRRIDDPELEQLRRRSRFRQNVVLFAGVVGFAIPIVFSTFGAWGS